VNVSARDQVEYFSPPFEAAVKRGKTQSVMCSCERHLPPAIPWYLGACQTLMADPRTHADNAVNGVPACLSGGMLNDKMRDSWGFDGFVVSSLRARGSASLRSVAECCAVAGE
jgi:beta-glucosidase-like glycosyl hydrolase